MLFLVLVLGLAANVCFVKLDNAAHLLESLARQSVAYAVSHEPRALILFNVQVPHELMRADALLTRKHQVNRQQPFVKRDVRILKDALDRDGELFAASRALPQTFARLAYPLAFGLQ